MGGREGGGRRLLRISSLCNVNTWRFTIRQQTFRIWRRHKNLQKVRELCVLGFEVGKLFVISRPQIRVVCAV